MSVDIMAEWMATSKRIENALTDLRADQIIFKGFMEIVESNPELPDNNLFIVWAWRNYLFTAAMAVRRLLSKCPDDVSLVNLLEGIKRQPQVLSRGRYSSLFKGTGFEKEVTFINEGFDSVVGEGRDALNESDVAKDIESLKAVAEPVRTYVNKIIAHADRNADSIQALPTIRDLNDSIDQIEAVFKKYYFLMNAGSIEFPKAAQVPWKAVFLKPWKFDKKNLC